MDRMHASDGPRRGGLPPRRVRLVIYAVIAVAVGWSMRGRFRHRPDTTMPKPPAASKPASGPRVRPLAPEVVRAWQEREEEPAEAVGEVTYAEHVAPILQRKCQACHRPGQVAPFSLLTYDQARRWAAAIGEVVSQRRMPPWHPDPRYGHFANNRSLSPRERATLLAWVERKAPLGDASRVPPPRQFPEGWSIGTPDVVLTMPEPFTVPAEGVVNYQHFHIPTGFDRDVWVQAAEARPGDAAVVHHICVFLDEKAANEEGRMEKPELVCFAPGDMPSVFPSGTAKRIPAGVGLLIQVHYTPVGRPKKDRSSVALVFAKEPPRRLAVTKGVSNKTFFIPAGAKDLVIRSSFTFPFDAHLLSLMPHMHYRGKDFLYRATYPDGRSEILLSVPAYDFGWQSVYRLADPKAMPRGTRIDCVAHYDNSADNPANPDPSAAVHWGEQTWEEMMIGYLDYAVDLPVNATPPSKPPLPSVGAARRPGEARR